MSLIETLTEEDRAARYWLPGATKSKAIRIIDALTARVAELEAQLETAFANGAEQSVAECNALRVELSTANARAEAAELESAGRHTANLALCEALKRAESEAASLRARVSAEESARAQSETLLQQVGARLDAVQQAAHSACRLWESAENHSLHEIRMGMRTLREVINKPALRTEAASLRAESDRRLNRIGDLVSENTTLRAEIAAFEANLQDTEALKARLAAATELLGQVRASSRGRRWVKHIDAFLANAPAAPQKTLEMRMAEFDIALHDGNVRPALLTVEPVEKK